MYIFCTCADAHMHCCLSINWVDGVVYPLDYPVPYSSNFRYLRGKLTSDEHFTYRNAPDAVHVVKRTNIFTHETHRC